MGMWRVGVGVAIGRRSGLGVWSWSRGQRCCGVKMLFALSWQVKKAEAEVAGAENKAIT